MGASPGSGFGQGMTCGEEPTLGSPPTTDSTNSAYGPSRLAFRLRAADWVEKWSQINSSGGAETRPLIVRLAGWLAVYNWDVSLQVLVYP